MKKLPWQENVTLGLLVLTPVIWIAWDLYAFLSSGNQSTESANIFFYAHKYPAITLAWGYLSGHFFAQKRLPSTKGLPGAGPFWENIKAILALLGCFGWATVDIIFKPSYLTRLVQEIPGPGHGSLWVLVVGAVIGYFCFQMGLPTIFPGED